MQRHLRMAGLAGALALAVCGLASPAAAVVSTVRVAAGLSKPVYVTAPAGDLARLFILEQHTGQVRILDLISGTLNPTPFLTVPAVAQGGEQGLLGLAFHPNYASNGLFYVNRTDTAGNTQIERYQVSSDADVALATPTALLSIAQPQANHNGGWLGFGPDGFLYVSTGDGGGSNDNGVNHTDLIGNAQDTTSNLLGKLLRLDVDNPANGLPYGIPADNPFVGVEGDDEIWAYGLRNPWRAGFDRQTGDLWTGDVGQGAREEIDFQPADSAGGENYGWRLREGTIQTPGAVGGPAPPGAIDPIHEFPHTGTAPFRSVTGGYVYRGPIEELRGKYFFADYVTDNIWSITFDGSDPADFDGTNFVDFHDWTSELVPDQGEIRDISSFGEDALGNLYIVDLGLTTGGSTGEIFRVIPEPASAGLVGAALAALALARRRGRSGAGAA
jgi:glucose/arabinose dehydrogenase